MAASLPPAVLPSAHVDHFHPSYTSDKMGGSRTWGGCAEGKHAVTREGFEEGKKGMAEVKVWGMTQGGGIMGAQGSTQVKKVDKKTQVVKSNQDAAIRVSKYKSSGSGGESDTRRLNDTIPTVLHGEDKELEVSSASKQTAEHPLEERHANGGHSADSERIPASNAARSRSDHSSAVHAKSLVGLAMEVGLGRSSTHAHERRRHAVEGDDNGEGASEASSEQTVVLSSPCSTEPSRELSGSVAMDLDGFGAQGDDEEGEEWRQSAGKRKAEELGLDEDALMVAQILTGALGSVAQRKSSKTTHSRRTSAQRGLEGKDGQGELTTPPGSHALPKPSGPPRGPGTGHRRSGGNESYANVPVPAWARLVMEFLEAHGQELLHAICAHYRIDFLGDVSQIRDYSLEQIAHNALFNPALPKASGRLPKMLRDMEGVTDYKMTFVKERSGIFRNVRVSARLHGEPLFVECRACSYCGSCFSGRFMKPNAMHQQAGGWKEITERTQAGKYSWEGLRGWRLCVPCFTHWAANGTNLNANRPSIEHLLLGAEQHDLNYDIITAPDLPTGKAEVQHLLALNSRPMALAASDARSAHDHAASPPGTAA